MNSMIIGNNSNNSNSFNINNKFQKKIQNPVIPNKSNMNNSNNFNNKVVKPKPSSKRNVFTKNIFSIERKIIQLIVNIIFDIIRQKINLYF